MNDLQSATDKALEEFEKALPHIKAAKASLATALGLDLGTRPEMDYDQPEEHCNAVRLLQNIRSADLHVSDPFGS